MSRSRQSPLKPWEGVLHPAWWLSLVVLVLNDHVLKFAGVLPGWLTGKLSDFAGLVVAPVCLVTVLRVRRRWPRASVFAAVGIVFGALQLSPAFAGAVEAAAALLGWRCRIWPDPTDLLALPMLALAWRIAPPQTYETPRRIDLVQRDRHTQLRTIVAMLGAVACLATSSVCPEQTAAYLVNATHEDLDVEVYRVQQPINCYAVERDPIGQLSVVSFKHQWSERLKPFNPLGLDVPNETYYLECDAVLLRGPRIPDSILFWRIANRKEVMLENVGTDQPFDSNAVYIERFGDELILAADTVRVWPVLDL